MARRYRTRVAFRLDDDSILPVGAEIELEDDVAALHATQLVAIDPPPAVQTPAPAPIEE